MKKAVLQFAGWAAGWLPANFVQWIYQAGPIASLIRRTLNQAAPQGLTTVKVAGGALAGITLVLDMQSEKDYWLGSYEPELQRAVRAWVKPGSVVYDLGANIGYTSLLMARQAGASGRVFAFEALPANLERLHLNLESSGMGGRITVVPAAVIDRNQPVSFLVGPSGGMGKAAGSAGREEIAYPNTIQVQGISLDHYVFRQGNPPPQVIKIDIEGGEVLALPGMRKVLQECQPVILLELHGPESAEAAWTELAGAGYHVYRMQAGNPPVERLDDLEWKSYVAALPHDFKVNSRSIPQPVICLI